MNGFLCSFKDLKKKAKKKLAIFLPVYNESETLEALLQQIPKSVSGYKTEIIVVDDGSLDGSCEIAAKYTRHVVCLPENTGVGNATKVGFQYIKELGGFDFVVKFDADGQHRIELLKQTVKMLIDGADVVIVSRFHPESNHTFTPIDRVFLNTMFSGMMKRITGWGLTDARSGFMGLRFEDVVQIADHFIVPRYGIPMEILLRIWGIKPMADVREIPHPAIYGGDISEKLTKKYSSEKISDRTSRVEVAYGAFLDVVEDMKIPREVILQSNGFMNFDKAVGSCIK